jgi:LPXTG-motif cell wall-anchored protein
MTFKAGTTPVVKVDGAAPTTDYEIKYYDKATSDKQEVTDLSKAQYFELVINWTEDGTWAADHKYASNAVLTVDYIAFLDPAKKDQLVVGGSNDGNTNAATVQWYSDIDEPEVEEPKGDIPEVKTDTFTTELTILKQDQDGKALQGAEFTLTGPDGAVVITKVDSFVEDAEGEYWLLKDGTYTKQDPNGTIDGNPVDQSAYASLTDKYKVTTTYEVRGANQTNTDIKAVVGTDGKATFTGLGAGKYTLVETKVPDGYNKVDDIKFEITMTISDDNTSQTGKKVTFESDNNTVKVETDNTLMTEIVNRKGTELPSTGGIGTTIFYVLGSILVIGAGIVLITRRRMSN